jgi:hypothetical protein
MEEIDVVLNPNDYSTMPKYQLQELALAGDAKAERIYFERYGKKNKTAELTELFAKWAAIKADIEKNNPNRDSKGRFTFGAGGPQAGGGGGGGAGSEAGGGSGGAGAEAEQAGQAEPYEETDDYRMRHQAPTRADEFGSPATNIGDEMMPGFYEKPQLYGSAYEQADKESRSVLMSIKDKPNAPVTIYRAVPESVDKINPGDWVTLSPTYAKDHLRSNVSGGKIISQVIPAKDLWFDGNSINEFGYDPVDD